MRRAVEFVGYGVFGLGAASLVAVAAMGAIGIAGTAFVVVHTKDSFDLYRKNPVAARLTRRGKAWHYVHRAASYLPQHPRAKEHA